MQTVFGRTLDEIADLIDQHERGKTMPKDSTETTATFSGEAFMKAMDLLEWVELYKDGEADREHVQTALFEVMRLSAESAGAVTMEVSPSLAPANSLDVPEWNRKFVTDDPILDGLGYDTVLGWLAKNAPHHLNGLEDTIEDTQRDGFWLTRRCTEQGKEVIKVRSPDVMPPHLPMVNAYPVDLIARRFREKGVI